MDLLQIREKEIFETLKKISKNEFVVIGGYACNAYALPRFSIDCDIVVKSPIDRIEKELTLIGYNKVENENMNLPYHGSFVRYEKTIEHDFKVSMDILKDQVLDRQTGSMFSADWIFKNSEKRLLKGKTINENLTLSIINPNALIAMKIISCRNTDIRDVFMLITSAKDFKWIKEEIKSRCNFNERLNKLITKVSSKTFKDDLQGVYGYIDEKIFNKHLNLVTSLNV